MSQAGLALQNTFPAPAVSTGNGCSVLSVFSVANQYKATRIQHMADVDIDIDESPFASSPVIPEQFDEDHVIKFRCYKGIECFNACCRDIDITLTPYDILRLKQRLG